MNKNEYLNLKNEIDLKISEIRNESRKIDEEYINSNLELSVGNKVEITTPNRVEIGIISSKKVSYSGNPFYKFLKVKKDGSASKQELHIWGYPDDSNTKLIEQ